MLAGPHPGLAAEAAQFVSLPVGSDLKYAIAGAVPFQLLAYHLSVARGMSPDYPRNLSMTLTVDREDRGHGASRQTAKELP